MPRAWLVLGILVGTVVGASPALAEQRPRIDTPRRERIEGLRVKLDTLRSQRPQMRATEDKHGLHALNRQINRVSHKLERVTGHAKPGYAGPTGKPTRSFQAKAQGLRNARGESVRNVKSAEGAMKGKQQPHPAFCIGSCGPPPEIVRPGVGPAPSDTHDSDSQPALDPRWVREAQFLGKHAARHVMREGNASRMSISLEMGKRERKDAKQAIRQAARKDLHNYIREHSSRGPYRAIALEIARPAVGRLMAKKTREWRQGRRTAGLGGL